MRSWMQKEALLIESIMMVVLVGMVVWQRVISEN
jgi:hypothetical protein